MNEDTVPLNSLWNLVRTPSRAFEDETNPIVEVISN